MPDYNKGDFTQQGIDGFVEGGLHLNEKRCLTARISTDEETSGIDSIEINIHDHLNDLDYSISGENLAVGENVIGIIPSGNIAITENTAEGESLDVSQYATATVNVAGGGTDYPKCAATIVNTDSDSVKLLTLSNGMLQDITIPANSSGTIELAYFYDTEYEEYLVYSFQGYVVTGDATLVSNMVNMTTTTWGPDTVALKITDPTADSSVTLDASFMRDR